MHIFFGWHYFEGLITRKNKIYVRDVFNFLKVFDSSDTFLIFKCYFEIFRNFLKFHDSRSHSIFELTIIKAVN